MSSIICGVNFQVLTAASMKMTAFWDITPYSLEADPIIALMMETVRAYETSDYFNETTGAIIHKAVFFVFREKFMSHV
jgi:hypothetical protein